jgi:hypothetical protein
MSPKFARFCSESKPAVGRYLSLPLRSGVLIEPGALDCPGEGISKRLSAVDAKPITKEAIAIIVAGSKPVATTSGICSYSFPRSFDS